MIFSSPVFLFLFLPLALLFNYSTKNIRLKNYILLAFSLFFYAWGELAYTLVMLVSITINYGAALWIQRSRSGRALGIALVLNLALLAYFKYAVFLVGSFGLGTGTPPIHLPVGISFFTFHAISYLVDIYRGNAAARKDPVHTALYISFFPQLLAGPIVRYKDIAAQITSREESQDKFSSGAKRFTTGLAKKLLVANTMGWVADQVFSIPLLELTTGLSWLGIVAYTLQIYFDFSGYSDMAIGLARLFGFEFRENFDYPYIARSVREFWQRWHISLSTWFRDYVYIPLGGNRCAPARVYFNLVLVFFLTGLWHGASWKFVVWGLFHGTFLLLERLGLERFLKWLPSPLRHAYALLAVMAGWVLFRADSLSSAGQYLSAMAGFGAKESSHSVSMYLSSEFLFALTAGIAGCAPLAPWLRETLDLRAGAKPGFFSAALPASELVFFCLLLFISLTSLASQTYNPFIYFRF